VNTEAEVTMDRTAEITSRPRLPWRDELITCALLSWMIAGLYLDGWAHRNRNLHDSIVTPWHAVFYSGFLVAATWIVLMCARYQEGHGLGAVLRNREKWRYDRIPVGYAIGLTGVATFAVGGIGDQIWHLSLGVEQDLEAFLSPTHWLLAVGMFLMVSSPMRAAWSSFDSDRPGFREFLPTLWSITLTTATVSFAYNYLSLFVLNNVTLKDKDIFALFQPGVSFHDKFAFAERLRMQGVGGALIWTILLVGVSLLVLRRWRPPFGTFTAVYGLTVTGVNAVWNFDRGWTIVAAVIGGLFADYLVVRLDPRPTRLVEFRVFAGLVPLVMWGAYFAVVAIAYGIGWTTPMWAGLITFVVPVGLLLSFLMEPMAIPVAPPALATEPPPADVRELEGAVL
jgi:hypothetical protein